MPETPLTRNTLPKPFDNFSAGDLDLVWEAADEINGNSFVCTGKELLLARNTDAVTTYYITVNSVEDEKSRSEDITQYDIAPETTVLIPVGLTNSQGWKQTDGTVTLIAENSAIELAVYSLPAGYPGG